MSMWSCEHRRMEVLQRLLKRDDKEMNYNAWGLPVHKHLNTIAMGMVLFPVGEKSIVGTISPRYVRSLDQCKNRART